MNARLRWLVPGLVLAIFVAAILWEWHSAVAAREEPVYEGKPLSYWVARIGRIEEFDGVPEDAVVAIRAIGPKAVPFLIQWMPHRKQQRPALLAWLAQWMPQGFRDSKPKEDPPTDGVEFAWGALGTNGKSAIPILAKIINEPRRNIDDYSVWTQSAKVISYLGPDAIVPMLTTATNMQGQHELWELLHNFENLGTNGAAAVPSLINWANDPDEWVRDGVVSALGGIGQRPDLAVPVLLAALHDSNWMVRRDAAAALGAFADNSDAALNQLIKTLQDSEWQARGGALTGLGRVRSKPEIVVPLIAPFLFDHNNVIQRSAAYALRDLGSEAGFKTLLQASNAPGIGDIIFEVQEKASKHSK